MSAVIDPVRSAGQLRHDWHRHASGSYLHRGELIDCDIDVDLALAISVFTHLIDHWAAGIRRSTRVLRLGGRFICTFLGQECGLGRRQPWARIGMNILRIKQCWDHGDRWCSTWSSGCAPLLRTTFKLEKVKDGTEIAEDLNPVEKALADVGAEPPAAPYRRTKPGRRRLLGR